MPRLDNKYETEICSVCNTTIPANSIYCPQCKANLYKIYSKNQAKDPSSGFWAAFKEGFNRGYSSGDNANTDSNSVDSGRSVPDTNNSPQTSLREQLETIDPIEFEKLIARLYQAMGYTTTLTSATSDGGVDVVASIKVGPSSVTDAIQCKRYKGNISRPTLDALRGALPRFKASHGTIVTTGDFSQGCYASANEAGMIPLTLINGTKLIELLNQHQVFPYNINNSSHSSGETIRNSSSNPNMTSLKICIVCRTKHPINTDCPKCKSIIDEKSSKKSKFSENLGTYCCCIIILITIFMIISRTP